MQQKNTYQSCFQVVANHANPDHYQDFGEAIANSYRSLIDATGHVALGKFGQYSFAFRTVPIFQELPEMGSDLGVLREVCQG